MEDLTQDPNGVAAVALLFLGCLCVLTWILPRRSAAVPLLIATCYMPLSQQFIVVGLHFMFIRILLLVGWCRIFFKKETEGLRLTKLDKLFILWALVALVVGTLTKPSVERFITRSGEVYNAIGAYFLVRCSVRDIEDAIGLMRAVAAMVVPLGVAMLIERFTARNIFFVLGGVSESTMVREGALRCRGSFMHPILAGTYAATVFPLAMGLWFLCDRGDRRLAIAGGCGAVAATLTAHSSGPLMALMSAICGIVFWRLQYKMRMFRWGAVVILVALSLVMNAPVWYVMARLGDVTGGTGWHRAFLIDQAIAHFNEWWMIGSAYTAHWTYGGHVLPGDPDNMDITNEYIEQGLTGGIWKLGLLVAMIVQAFKIVGQWTGKFSNAPFSQRMVMWSLGVCLFGHCVSFLSVTYFDQIVVMWYWLLAVISALAAWDQQQSWAPQNAECMEISVQKLQGPRKDSSQSSGRAPIRCEGAEGIESGSGRFAQFD